MTQETRTIEVKVYRTPDGKPTCRRNNHACKFLNYAKFGTIPVCMSVDVPRDLMYYEHEVFTKPHANCELWKDQA